MKPPRFAFRTALVAATLSALAAFAAGDVFDFIPLGGRSLLAQVATTKAAAPDVNAMLAAKHTQAEWMAWLKAHGTQLPAVQKLSDTELKTVSDYMAFNLPLAPGKVAAGATLAAFEKALPWDGRDMALEKCQGCHIITVVITQNRTKEAWLGTMGKPSHVMIKLSKEQREQLANYLVLNAAIPIDQVPPELRAGGASY